MENVYKHELSNDSFADIDQKIQESEQNFIYDENDILEEIELEPVEEESYEDNTEDIDLTLDLLDEILKEIEMEKNNKD